MIEKSVFIEKQLGPDHTLASPQFLETLQDGPTVQAKVMVTGCVSKGEAFPVVSSLTHRAGYLLILGCLELPVSRHCCFTVMGTPA